MDRQNQISQQQAALASAGSNPIASGSTLTRRAAPVASTASAKRSKPSAVASSRSVRQAPKALPGRILQVCAGRRTLRDAQVPGRSQPRAVLEAAQAA